MRAKVDKALQGRGVGKLAGLDDVVRIAVEMRALPLRRLLTVGLRSWLPVHLIATGSASKIVRTTKFLSAITSSVVVRQQQPSSRTQCAV